jgi:hypothetical protein
MVDRPILFSAPMVRALLDGRKTQTRRLCKWANNPFSPQLSYIVACDEPGWFGDEEGDVQFSSGYAPGDRLWVKETWGINHYKYCRPEPIPKTRPTDLEDYEMVYFATEDDCEINNEMPRTPSIFMPRWASRLTLTVTDVRVQRLQEISRADAIAEGLTLASNVLEEFWRWPEPHHEHLWLSPPAAYRHLWDSINGAGSWEANPWIVALTFDVRKGNIDG